MCVASTTISNVMAFIVVEEQVSLISWVASMTTYYESEDIKIFSFVHLFNT